MTEEFLHYLWRFQLIDQPLMSMDGEYLEVVSPGIRNHDSGPDYLNARIRIGDTLWAGDVEIHVKASDWMVHAHDVDRAFGSVILHVVHEGDREICRPDGQSIPTLNLSGRYDSILLSRYENFLSSISWIPCANSLLLMEENQIKPWLNHLAEVRISRRSGWIDRLFIDNQGHAETSLYHCLAAGYGLKVNAEPFTWLAKRLDLRMVMRHQDELLSLEALFFGQAGFLNEPAVDDYQASLLEQYHFFKAKYHLEPLEKHIWKFLRMRPAGFPTVRIAHFAAFLHEVADHPARLLKWQEPESIFSMFGQEVSPYWQVHYHFGKAGHRLPATLGKDAILNIVLNCLIPFRYVMALRAGEQLPAPELLEMMSHLPAEDNTVTRSWRQCGIEAETALESQALLELKNQYCNLKNCLQCDIGRIILSLK
ncbi:MAG TPA: DUF2851 family protein [Bacteroidales bacterium]|nr:DUF2851 family protein [Bacteroidales bacterium]HSA43218.1 DUF2851 family protein [Bacteroidales bacterium]